MLNPEEKGELQRLAAKVHQFVTTDAFHGFDEIAGRFNQLLREWSGADHRAHTSNGHYGKSATAEAAQRPE